MHRRETCPRLTFPIVEHVIQATTLPDLKEQLDNLILWVARTSKGFGVPIIRAVFDKALGPVGAANPTGLDFIFQRAEKTNLIEVERTQLHGGFLYQNIVLTFEGWNHYEEVQRAATNSRLAFMAMKFGNTQTERIYREFFKPAVAQTGFELRRNDEEQRAGLIDDLMRVQIRQSRFVLSDLTDHNNGAYWEAGYAEGLGKPVIYTCREDHFDDPSMGAHFDTNHHLTVLWNPDNMAPAVEKLKATIRATLPEDASLEDVLTPLG